MNKGKAGHWYEALGAADDIRKEKIDVADWEHQSLPHKAQRYGLNAAEALVTCAGIYCSASTLGAWSAVGATVLFGYKMVFDVMRERYVQNTLKETSEDAPEAVQALTEQVFKEAGLGHVDVKAKIFNGGERGLDATIDNHVYNVTIFPNQLTGEADIYIGKPVLEKLDKDDLAAILRHETGHYHQSTLLERNVSNVGKNIAYSVMAMSFVTGNFMAAGKTFAAILASKVLSAMAVRVEEYVCDRNAVGMKKDAKGLISGLDKLINGFEDVRKDLRAKTSPLIKMFQAVSRPVYDHPNFKNRQKAAQRLEKRIKPA